MTTDVANAHPLSLTFGGPVYALARRLHMAPPAYAIRLVLLVAVIAWCVPLSITLIELAVGHPASHALLRQIGFHARALIGIPLLIVADLILEERVSLATEILLVNRIVRDDALQVWARLVERIEHWRDRAIAEVVPITVVAFVLTIVLVHLLPFEVLWLLPAFHGGGADAMSSPAWWFYVFVVQPTFLFLFVRFLWHWCLWAAVLVALARMHLALEASHPDRAAGIGFLRNVLDAFNVAVLAVSIVLTCSWADEIMATGAAAATFAPSFVSMVIVCLALPLASYLPLSISLMRSKRMSAKDFGGFAGNYIEAFDRKWLNASGAAALGSRDVQALADTGTAYRNAEEMRVTVFTLEAPARLIAAALLPVIPLLASGMSAQEIAKRIITHFF